MVVVENRIFARSWGFAESSWYNAFLNDPDGKIKCGDQEFKITAKINAAYLDKYNSGDNSKYAVGITQKKHSDKTMEFILS